MGISQSNSIILILITVVFTASVIPNIFYYDFVNKLYCDVEVVVALLDKLHLASVGWRTCFSKRNIITIISPGSGLQSF